MHLYGTSFKETKVKQLYTDAKGWKDTKKTRENQTERHQNPERYTNKMLYIVQ